MKEKLKLLGAEFLFMLCVIIVSAFSGTLQFACRGTGENYRGILFAGTIYRYNILTYILGVVMFAAFVYYAYIKYFKNVVRSFRKEGSFMKFFYVVIALITSFLMFAAMIGCDLFMLGLNDEIRPEALFYLTGFGWPVFILVFMLAVLFVKEKERS